MRSTLGAQVALARTIAATQSSSGTYGNNREQRRPDVPRLRAAWCSSMSAKCLR